MVLFAILVLAGLFAALFFVRVGGARRRQLLERWPALALAAAALFSASRGAVWPALALAALAAAAWQLWPWLSTPIAKTAPSPDTPAEAQARSVLGVSANATEGEIRRAYRNKMRDAHPDRGGSHDVAARLTAARDTLLRKPR